MTIGTALVLVVGGWAITYLYGLLKYRDGWADAILHYGVLEIEDEDEDSSED